MNRIVLLLLVAVSACAGKQPLRVECEKRLVRINEAVGQIDVGQHESHAEEEERQP